MSKWKCEICGKEFDNFHAQGFDNKIYCPLCYFKKENQELQKQLEYLRSGEYYNQLRFENEMLQQVVDTNGVPSEVYDYIDCTHRNTELLEENQKYKEVIDRAIKRLEKGIFIIPNDTNELLDILKEVE